MLTWVAMHQQSSILALLSEKGFLLARVLVQPLAWLPVG
jgi:hypothetical protein